MAAGEHLPCGKMGMTQNMFICVANTSRACFEVALTLCPCQQLCCASSSSHYSQVRQDGIWAVPGVLCALQVTVPLQNRAGLS